MHSEDSVQGLVERLHLFTGPNRDSNSGFQSPLVEIADKDFFLFQPFINFPAAEFSVFGKNKIRPARPDPKPPFGQLGKSPAPAFNDLHRRGFHVSHIGQGGISNGLGKSIDIVGIFDSVKLFHNRFRGKGKAQPQAGKTVTF